MSTRFKPGDLIWAVRGANFSGEHCIPIDIVLSGGYCRSSNAWIKEDIILVLSVAPEGNTYDVLIRGDHGRIYPGWAEHYELIDEAQKVKIDVLESTHLG